MILFASGRCDIPAYYANWFYQRIKEGYVDVRNPFDEHQISRIPLTSYDIDAILFCTKNPIPMLKRLDEIQDIPYIFHITLTPYHQDIEKHVPAKRDIIDAIKFLSKKLGPHRVVLRYDPILLSDLYTIPYHIKAMKKLAQELHGYIETCIISFVDEYKNTKKNMTHMRMKPMAEEDMRAIGKAFGEIGKTYGIHIQTCAETIDLSMYGVETGACVSKETMERLLGRPYDVKSTKNVRDCKCLPFVDIGDYNCCGHLCSYCYANYDEKQVCERMKRHDPMSSVLLGHLGPEDHIKERKEKASRQLSLL